MNLSSPPKSAHLLAVLLLMLCAGGYLFDVLFLDKHLSAFDVFLNKSAWKEQYGHVGMHNHILSDSPTGHYPDRKVFYEAARAGQNPTYYPYIFTGMPTKGQGLGIFATSPFQFFMGIANAVDWNTALRLVLSAVFMYILMIQLGLGSGIGILAAIAWSYNAHQIAWLMYPQHLATQLWMPLLLGINILLLKSKFTLFNVLPLIVCLLLFFTSGYTQIVLFTFIFIGLFNTLFLLINNDLSLKEKLFKWLSIHSVYLAAGLLLLPEALWQANEISDGIRGFQTFRNKGYELDLSLNAFKQLAIDIFPRSLDIVRVLAPNYLDGYGQTPGLKAIYQSNSVEYQAFFGVIILYLSLYALIKGVIKRSTIVTSLAISLLIMIALFNQNGLLIYLLNLIPFANSGSYSRYLTLLIFICVVLAGFGCRYFIEDLKQKNRVFLFLPLSIIFIWLALAKINHPDILAVRELIIWLAYLLVFIFICILLFRLNLKRMIIPLMIVLTFSELIYASYRFNTRLDLKLHFPENPIIDYLKNSPGNFRTALLMNDTSYHHNIFTYHQLPTIGGYSTVVPNRYAKFMEKTYGKLYMTLNGIMFLFEGDTKLLRMLNTKYIVSNLPLQTDQLETILKLPDQTLYQLNDPLPRVICASHQFINDNDIETIQHLPGSLARFDKPVFVATRVAKDKRLTDNCQISDLKVYLSKLEFNVQTDRQTILFLPVNYHRYWQATINDSELAIHRANVAFMAVVVPEGTNQIKFEFINKKLILSAIVFLLFGLFIIIFALLKIKTPMYKLSYVLLGCLIIGKSLLTIPPIMNNEIPERPFQQQTD